jgi:monoamine oxidase
MPPPPLLDVAIIGGGVCGLALAHSLQARRVDWRLFEARERLGGRVLTRSSAQGVPLDLGATWYWPGHQPSITRLVEDLGLPTLAQPDDGRVLLLHDPNRTPETVAVDQASAEPAHGAAAEPLSPGLPGATAVHGGARRLAGGMGALVQALAAPLPAARLALGHTLITLVDHGDFVELRLRDAAEQGPAGAQPRELSVLARRVVLALPPRVVAASLHFEPALPAECQAALAATPTWMATAAKAGMGYERSFWRAQPHRGNAWVTHPQAVLAEVFDAGPAGAEGSPGALAGFLALGAQARQAFRSGMPLLLRSQLGQLFGAAAEAGELHQQDWALEPTTCSPLDAAQDALPAAHAEGGHPLLAEPAWQGRLHFGGSETARLHAGYLEGALGAAARLRRALLPAAGLAGAAHTAQPAERVAP